MDFNISWKYKDYELRKTSSLSKAADYWELVKWQDNNSCFVLAYFAQDKEGWELKFVGDRPFEYIEEDDLFTVWNALKMTCRTLNDYFNIARVLDE